MLNKWIGIGRIGQELELKRTTSDKSVVSFSIAVERDYAPKGQKKETDWFEVTAWGATAEFICRYLDKGRKVAIEGRLQRRSWEDKQGNKRHATEIVAEKVDFADSAPQGSQRGDYDEAPTDDLDIDDVELPYTQWRRK